MPFALNTSRGNYTLSQVAPAESMEGAMVVTIALERNDGLEKVALRCRIDIALVNGLDETAIMERLGQWIERDFETIRETALKSIRSERKLTEVVFDTTNRGPF